MRVIECDQNTQEWINARLGVITASSVHKIITPTGLESGQKDKYERQLVAELIRGEQSQSFSGNAFTERGHDMEQEAADYYKLLTGEEPQKVGFCLADDGVIGASPDRLIGECGILEIKTCLPEIMVDQYEQTTFHTDHKPQTQCQLYVTGRDWVDTMIYCTKMDPIIVRSLRDDAYIEKMKLLCDCVSKSIQARLRGIIARGYNG